MGCPPPSRIQPLAILCVFQNHFSKINFVEIFREPEDEDRGASRPPSSRAPHADMVRECGGRVVDCSSCVTWSPAPPPHVLAWPSALPRVLLGRVGPCVSCLEFHPRGGPSHHCPHQQGLVGGHFILGAIIQYHLILLLKSSQFRPLGALTVGQSPFQSSRRLRGGGPCALQGGPVQNGCPTTCPPTESPPRLARASC